MAFCGHAVRQTTADVAPLLRGPALRPAHFLGATLEAHGHALLSAVAAARCPAAWKSPWAALAELSVARDAATLARPALLDALTPPSVAAALAVDVEALLVGAVTALGAADDRSVLRATLAFARLSDAALIARAAAVSASMRTRPM
jgi:hypothetical protein